MKLRVSEMMCLIKMAEFTRRDRTRKHIIRNMLTVSDDTVARIDGRLQWFEHITSGTRNGIRLTLTWISYIKEDCKEVGINLVEAM